MADTFGLEIYASNKLAFAGRAKTLTIPAVDGEQAFLAQHENIVAAIIPGEMRFEEADGTKHVLAVSSGFVDMINNRVKLFCLTAESPEEIDIRRAQEAKERAEEQMRQKQPGLSLCIYSAANHLITISEKLQKTASPVS